MKKPILWAALCLLGLAACQKTPASSEPATVEAPEGQLSIQVLPQTKAPSGETRFSKVLSVQVFVFRQSDGIKETDRYSVDANEINAGIKLSTLTGKKIVWAVVNAPRLYVNTEEELKTKASALSDNRLTGVVMTGYNSLVDVQPYKLDNPEGTRTPVHIDVSRLGARVSLQKVYANFQGTALENCTLTIKGLYLKNVVNTVNYNRSSPSLSAESRWNNRLTWQSSNVDGLISDRNLSITCSNNGTVPTSENVGRSWYVYPNPTVADSNSDTWSPRHTRLVLHASVSGTVNGEAYNKENTYYVFTLPVIEGNHTYDIQSILITMLGNDDDDDDDPTTAGKIAVTISVNPWDDELTLNYEI